MAPYRQRNEALTRRGWVMVTVHVPVPLHPSPLQPAKSEFDAAVARSVTAAPEAKVELQMSPQLIPAGSEATVPLPSPVFPTVRVNAWSGAPLIRIPMKREPPLS